MILFDFEILDFLSKVFLSYVSTVLGICCNEMGFEDLFLGCSLLIPRVYGAFLGFPKLFLSLLSNTLGGMIILICLEMQMITLYCIASA